MNSIDKILIIRFSSMGDIILASPFIRVLRHLNPEARIDFLVKSEYAELVRFNHHLSMVIELTSSGKEELKQLKQTIRDEKYDVIFDLHNSLRSRYLRTFSGARHVAVVNKRVFARFMLVKFKWNIYGGIVSVASRYLETGKPFGLQDDGRGLEIFIPDDIEFNVAAVISKLKLERYDIVVGIAPTAKHKTKQWLPDRFVEFSAKFSKERKAKIFIFGGKEESEYCGDIAHMINANIEANIAENFAGRLSLLETAAALDFCDLVVSNDTGLMHLAAARQRKVVAIFGSTVQEFGFHPCGTKSIVVERKGLYCRPCSHIGLDVCPQGHFRCMKDIGVEDVLSSAREIVID
jgi:lipopolysaccharide heptosyltransferase II